jgi:DNA-binding MarR family transcriptional regulator
MATDGLEVNPPPLGPQGLGFLLGKVHRALRRRWEAVIADLGLTAAQAALLRAVASHPGQGIRELARSLGTDPMNVWRLAETLAHRGLVESTSDPSDRRRRCLEVTDGGNLLAQELTLRAARTEKDLARALGTATYDWLMQTLSRLGDHLEDRSAHTGDAWAPRDDHR